MQRSEPKLCSWMNPPCKEVATIRVPRTNSSFCEDHYLLNVIRFGCDLKGEPIPKTAEGKKESQ